MTRSHVLLGFFPMMFIGASLRGHVSFHDSASVRLNRDRSMSLKRSTAQSYARALIVIGWTGVYEIEHVDQCDFI